MDIRESRFNAFAEAYREAVKGDALLESVCEIYISNLKRKGVASLPPLTKAEAPTTLVALRAAGFEGRITRKGVLAWFDGE